MEYPVAVMAGVPETQKAVVPDAVPPMAPSHNTTVNSSAPISGVEASLRVQSISSVTPVPVAAVPFRFVALLAFETSRCKSAEDRKTGATFFEFRSLPGVVCQAAKVATAVPDEDTSEPYKAKAEDAPLVNKSL